MSVLAAYRGLLRNRALTRLLVGEFVSSIGDWLYLVALLIVVYEASGSAFVLGVIGAARVAPYIFLSVPAGIAADRLDRRMILIVTDIARGLIMVALAVITALNGPLWLVVALTILATCFSSFFGPTIGAFLPTLVDERELGPANSAWASLDNLAFVVGPAIGGLLIAAGGVPLAFVLNAVSFAFVAYILWRLPTPTRAPTVSPAVSPASPTAAAEASSQPGSATDAPEAAGAAEAAAAPEAPGAPKQASLGDFIAPLSGLALIDLVGGFVFGGLSILTVIIAVDILQAGEAGTGFLNAAIGVGGLIGAVGSGALVLRRRLGPPLVAGGVLLGLGLVVLGQSGSLAPALVAMTIASAGSLLMEVVSTTLFQRIVPDAVRGRALGVMETLGVGAYSVGSLALPLLAGVIGVTPVLVASGIAMAAAAVGGVLLVGRAAIQAPELGPLAARLASLPIFAGLPPARIEAAARQVAERPVEAGEVVIREGDPADRFYVIRDGRFRVTQDAGADAEPRELRTLGPGDVFGELGLLTGAPRSATVTAIEPGTLLALDGPAFLDLAGSGPGLSSRLIDLYRGASTGGQERAPRGPGGAAGLDAGPS